MYQKGWRTLLLCLFNQLLFWRSRCFRPRDKVSYIHAITDSFSCRHEKLSDTVWTLIRYVTLHFIGAARLRTVTEISPKSPLLCVNKSPIRYGFRAGAKVILYSVNIALNSLVTLMGMNSVVQVFLPSSTVLIRTTLSVTIISISL